MSPDYFNSIVTAVVGLIALLVYWLTKRHEKESAAAIIIMDIRHAEQIIVSLIDRGVIDRASLKPILHENNWAKYKHLFASSFSYDDLSTFNRFFDSCVEIAEARKRMNEVFYAAVNAKGVLLQEKVLEIEDLQSEDGQRKRAALIEKFNAETCAFDPIEPKNIVLQQLNLMGRPSNSIAFAKLKKIAGFDK